MSNRVLQWIEGELTSFADMNQENETMFAFAAAFAQIILGSSNINAMAGGLTAQAQAGSLTVVVAGGVCVISGQIVDEIPSTALTCSANSTTETRQDQIIAQFQQIPVNPFQRNVRQPDTTVIEETVYEYAQSVVFAINPHGTAVPNGYVVVGVVNVPPNSENFAGYEATITLPTLESFIAGMSVSSLNGLIGALALACPDGSITVTPVAPGQIQIKAAAAAASVTSLNDEQGALTIECPDGTIVVDASGSTISLRAVVASAVTSVNALTGAVKIDAGAGISVGQATVDGETVIEIAATADSYPLGATIYRFLRLSGSNGQSVQLPALPTGTWQIVGRSLITVLGYNTQLSLSGCASSEGAQVNGPAAANSPSIVQITGTANAGQAPKLTWQTIPSSGSNSVENAPGLLELTAIRLS